MRKKKREKGRERERGKDVMNYLIYLFYLVGILRYKKNKKSRTRELNRKNEKIEGENFYVVKVQMNERKIRKEKRIKHKLY